MAVEVAHAVADPEGLLPGAIEEMTLREYVRRILKNERVSRAMQDWVDGLKAVALIEKFAGPGPGR